MSRPLTVDDIATMMKERGDERSIEALRVHVSRTIREHIKNDGPLASAYKANPGRSTSPWLVPVDAVEEWFASAEPKEDIQSSSSGLDELGAETSDDPSI